MSSVGALRGTPLRLGGAAACGGVLSWPHMTAGAVIGCVCFSTSSKSLEVVPDMAAGEEHRSGDVDGVSPLLIAVRLRLTLLSASRIATSSAAGDGMGEDGRLPWMTSRLVMSSSASSSASVS